MVHGDEYFFLFPLFCIFVFRMGAHERKEGNPPRNTEQKFKLVKIIEHPGYNERTMSNDIALLKLQRKATLDE